MLGVIVIALALFAADVALVRVAASHRSESGVLLHSAGTVALARGDYAHALEQFRAAHNHAPENLAYHLAFADALKRTGRTAESRAALNAILGRSPAWGPANAEMARALARDGEAQRAAWYYHRALYGEWPADTDLRSLRFELAELLARSGTREQLISELVLLDAESARPEDRPKLAALLLAAGQWDRSLGLYKELATTEPANPEFILGKARALEGLGRFVAAERELRAAVSTGHTDARLNDALAFATRVNSLDPTLRRLSSAERHRRAHELLDLLITSLKRCNPDRTDLDENSQRLATHQRGRFREEYTEQDLQSFEELWISQHSACEQTPRELATVAALLTR